MLSNLLIAFTHNTELAGVRPELSKFR